MANLVKRFEDLECWREARLLARTVYAYVKKKPFYRDYKLTGQITDAAVSIMNNISEGFDSASNPEFIRFLGYSRRSASEVQNCLYVALDQEYVVNTEFQSAYDQAEKIRRMIDGLIRYLAGRGKNRPSVK